MLRAIYMWINNCYPRLSYCWYIPGFDVENCLPMSVDIANDMRYTADQLTWGYDTTDVACIVGISTSQVMWYLCRPLTWQSYFYWCLYLTLTYCINCRCELILMWYLLKTPLVCEIWLTVLNKRNNPHIWFKVIIVR